MRITIPEEKQIEIKEWARKCYETNRNMYARRNQSNPARCITQIFEGKCAEEAVYMFLKNELQSPPDYKIYSAKQKSYDADLLYNDGVELHVKSQSRYPPYSKSNSWVFAKKDNPTGLVAFCTYKDGDVYIEYIIDTDLLDYGEPIFDKLKPYKKCVYAYDLQEFKDEMRNM